VEQDESAFENDLKPTYFPLADSISQPSESQDAKSVVVHRQEQDQDAQEE
jgi:hypothetical protein